ncbi:YopX family protein [Latilactobacillus sakei]|uniref:YopX family protein n=1 Tax=Latilactobacillus sakei TaxID=1599 RepID=UPI0038887A05
MRKIKFRAWHRNRKTFLDFYWAVDKLGRTFSILDKYVYDEFTDEIELMQYTGLKDINGVEIYEGDIVRVNYSGNDDFSGLALVVFRNGCFELEGKIMEIINSEGIMYDDFYAISNDLSHYSACVKAIGNKFKNPELLEAIE